MLVQLTRGMFATIDDHNADLEVYKWYCSADGYAMRSIYAEGTTSSKEYLHRVVLNRKLEREEGRSMRENAATEFKNFDALDCREENLREISWAAEVDGRKWQPPRRTVRIGHKNPTGEKYVYQRRNGKFQVQTPATGKMVHIGTFATREEAVAARDKELEEQHDDRES